MNFKRISVTQAQAIIADGPCTIADIRDAQSYANGHMPNDIALNNDNLAEFIAKQEKQIPLIVCCYHGNSSQQAAGYLAEQGFADCYSLDGGYEAWQLAFAK